MYHKKEYTSEDNSTLSDVSDGSFGCRTKRQKTTTRSSENKFKGESTSIAANSTSENDIVRKEMGLGWMLKSKTPAVLDANEIVSEEVQVEEPKTTNPRELNPYLKDDVSGYPEESDGVDVAACELLSSSLVGDGGASWRLKALKRAQEQAAREGRSFQEVVVERWGCSLGELTASVASKAAAPARAHLHAMKSTQRRVTGENSLDYEKPMQRDSKVNLTTNQLLTQNERCHFCLENPNRDMHLVVSIANFTYLMLPRLQPLVPGHCCILPIHAIDEVEDEWSQNNAKKLIDTSQKGLRNSIPEHFPYFHVEFGINRGFVHVIDNEKNFKSRFGLNVLRGMLKLSEEDMYRPPKYATMEIQKQALATFSKQWQKFDWTDKLH